MSFTGRGNTGGFGMTTTEALGEKAEMRTLNSKLADYIERVRALKKSAALGLDPRDYQESMKQLENEVLKLKQLYEDEINRLRRKLDEANKKNAALQAENDKNAHLGKVVIEQTNKAKRLEEENDALRRALGNAEKAIEDLQAKLKRAEMEAMNGHKWNRDNDQLRRDMNDEVKRRQAAEAAAKQANDKNLFDSRVHDQQLRELGERSRAQQDIINALEKRLKAMSKDNGDLPGTLQKMRDANQAEMKKFQKETEAALNKNMDALKKQLAEDQRAKDQMARDMKELESALRALAARNEEIEGQNKGLKAANQSLQAENDNDRARAQAKVNELERKLKELQDQLMDHSKEFVNARDAQASLRNEIDTYRILLDQEGQRLASRQGSRGDSRQGNRAGAHTPAYGKSQANGLPTLSGQNTPKSAGRMRHSYQPSSNSYHTTYRVDYTPKARRF